MGLFHIGLVSDYRWEKDGFGIVLDTGQSALVPLAHPVEERFLTGAFSEELFARNYGVGLYCDDRGRAVWYRAQICAIITGAAYRRNGRLLGIESWSPEWTPDASLPTTEQSALQERTITMNMVGGTAAPYYLRGDSPAYAMGGAVLRDAVAGVRIVNNGTPLRGRAAKEAIETLQGGSGVGVHFARVDFAYTRTREILYLQKPVAWIRSM